MPKIYIQNSDLTLYHKTRSDDPFDKIDFTKCSSSRLVPESFSLTGSPNDKWTAANGPLGKATRQLTFILKKNTKMAEITGNELTPYKEFKEIVSGLRMDGVAAIKIVGRSDFPTEYCILDATSVVKIKDESLV